MVKIIQAIVCPMNKTNLKLLLAVGLAAATLALVLTVVVGGPAVLQQAGVAMAFVMSAIALAAAAFVMSWKQKSFPIAGLLAASGAILMIPGLIATGYLSIIVFPGPILGVIFGLIIFGLGIAKGIRTARSTAAVITAGQ
jgi:hypothetical protein